ncbi:MAG: hydantoinase B/oxoprolinase family protein, partial [Rhizobiaceae bacterium]|nr:hydantoinase B/oxoprolinase family protein [Rhizobiaceae bacterium]
TYGNERYQNYETICSGSPAGQMNSGEGFAGTDAVHVHMTNTRMTDPEILEMRFTIIVEEFSIRANSGGVGKFPGGNGTIRRLRFLEEMECAILSSHRKRGPAGINGGGAGKVGKTEIRRKDGTLEELEYCDQTTVYPGEAVIVTTPAGGAFGKL